MKNFFIAILLLCLLHKIKAKEICCPGLGCYTDDDPFRLLPLPQCPEKMDIVMKVYTRESPFDGQIITRNSIPPVFRGNVTTMFIVHGWLQSEIFQWMHDMKNAALKQGDYNVIIVGWKGGSQNPNYAQSASNTRTVGGEIALVANKTIEAGGSAKSRMYCVGHSLGSHVCGHAGQQGQFGRITGLDPAGPLFDDRDWKCGLNPSCADLVDVIHTNGRTLLIFGLGTLKPLGHIDFYPNGGTQQPGCVLDPFSGILNIKDLVSLNKDTISIGIDFTLGCSHIRAYEFFTESILTPCFLSYKTCKKPDTLPIIWIPSCISSPMAVQSLGFNASQYSSRGIFYLNTNSASPFCRG